jgi:DNA-directed RNA polymerase specialized sigma24 family protein
MPRAEIIGGALALAWAHVYAGVSSLLAHVRKAGSITPYPMSMRSTSVHRSPVIDLEQVYREQAARLYRALLLYAGSPEVAADAVAEAFAQALGRGEAIHAPERWIWKAAFNIAAGELAYRRRTTSDHIPEIGYEIPETPIELSLVMGRLSPMQRAAVALHDFAGYSLRDTASIAGSTASAVSVHLVRAHTKLRKLLEEHDEG